MFNKAPCRASSLAQSNGDLNMSPSGGRLIHYSKLTLKQSRNDIDIDDKQEDLHGRLI